MEQGMVMMMRRPRTSQDLTLSLKRARGLTDICRGIDLVDFSSATNIAGSKFDSHKNAVAPKGKLDKSVTPATYTSFISIIDPTNLARFGLHNGE